MSEAENHYLETILRLCEKAAPAPWYPSVYVREAGIAREVLDPHLDRLRMSGLIHLTPWEKDVGQGYALTPEGARLLTSPRDLYSLHEGKLPAVRVAAEPPAVRRGAALTPFERGEAIRSALLDQQRPFVTQVLIALNLLVFVGGMLLAVTKHIPINQFLAGSGKGAGGVPVAEVLHATGALHGPDLLQGEWWRLLSCCFVHFGLLHLGVNMYSLYVIGPISEQMWGRWRFLAIYLIAGLGGTCAMMIANPNSLGAGASGALWGMMASQLAWTWLNRSYLPPPLTQAWMRSLLTVFLINAFISMMPGISAAGHFGGGFLGLLAAGLANTHRFTRGVPRLLSLVGLLILPVVCVTVLVLDMRTDKSWAVLALREEMLQRDRESQTFVEDCLKPINAMTATLRLTLKNVQPVIEFRTEERDPAEVRKALATVATQRAELENLAQQVRGTGPFKALLVEEARESGLEYVEAGVELLRRAERCLQVGENPKQDEKAWNQQQQVVQSKEQSWSKAIKPIQHSGLEQ